ncbi:hypothetical protein GCM10022245_58000 [Streptomyces mayteni]
MRASGPHPERPTAGTSPAGADNAGAPHRPNRPAAAPPGPLGAGGPGPRAPCRQRPFPSGSVTAPAPRAEAQPPALRALTNPSRSVGRWAPPHPREERAPKGAGWPAGPTRLTAAPRLGPGRRPGPKEPDPVKPGSHTRPRPRQAGPTGASHRPPPRRPFEPVGRQADPAATTDRGYVRRTLDDPSPGTTLIAGDTVDMWCERPTRRAGAST